MDKRNYIGSWLFTFEQDNSSRFKTSVSFVFDWFDLLLYIYYYQISLFRNIFLKENSLKIGDLGEAVIVDNDNQIINLKNSAYRGTPAYMSPELYSFHNYNNAEITFKTDIWSAGIIIFEMINLKMPIPSPIFNTDTPDDLKLIVNL